jgi:RHS repeat-associated protein
MMNYIYPVNSNLLKRTSGSTDQYSYDYNGNIRNSVPLSVNGIGYDPFTLLTMSETTATNGTLYFEYDGRKERVLKKVVGSTTTSTLYLRGLNDYPLVEKTSSGTERRYIYGPTGLIACIENNVAYYMLKDHLGSTRALMNGNTGTGVEFYAYDAWGKVMQSQVATNVRYTFTGQEFESQSGLYNFRARMYDENISRFYAMDPAMEGFSPYSYAGNNPVSFVDPDGKESKNAKEERARREAERAAARAELSQAAWRAFHDPYLDAEWSGMGSEGFYDWQTNAFIEGRWNGLRGPGYGNGGVDLPWTGVGNPSKNSLTVEDKGHWVDDPRPPYSIPDKEGYGITTVDYRPIWVPDYLTESNPVDVAANGVGVGAGTIELIMDYGSRFIAESDGLADITKVGDVADALGKFTGVVSVVVAYKKFDQTHDTGDFLKLYFTAVSIPARPLLGFVLGISDATGLSDKVYREAGGIIDHYTGKGR